MSSPDCKLYPNYHHGGIVKKIVGNILLVVMLPVILLGGLGCDLLPDVDYINVAVSASINAEVSNGVSREPWAGVHLQIEIYKAGGENEIFNKITNTNGEITEQSQATFKVYREQDVQIFVRPISGVLPLSMDGEIFDPSKHSNYSGGNAILPWLIIEDVGWGETYYWSPHITLSLFVSQS